MKKKVGILGGSFDPVHFGHINLALAIMEACKLDEVLFVPAQISPFKEHEPPKASAERRLELLRAAIAPLPSCRILDWELKNPGPSYTIDTVRKLSADKDLELHLLLGEDVMATFPKWKEANELARLAPPLVGVRNLGLKGEIGFKKVLIPLLDISSTQVRERLLQKKYCGHLVPASVLDIIAHHRLY